MLIGIGATMYQGGRPWAGIPRDNLAAAFDAQLGVTASGGYASAWADRSGNGRHLLQAVGANQPHHLPYIGNKYGWFSGAVLNSISAPDSALNSVTGDLDIRVKGYLTDWTPATNNSLRGKWSAAPQLSYLFYVEAVTGKLKLATSANGTAVVLNTASTAAPVVADGATLWVRATLDVDNGAGGNDLKFYTSADGLVWTQLGSTITTAGATSIYDSTSVDEIGASGAGSPLNGGIYESQIYNGIAGTLVADFNPDRDYVSGSTFVSSTTGETYTINATGSKQAQIVTRSSLLFDGVAHFMKCAAFTLNQPATVYFAGKQITFSNNDTIFDGETLNSMRLYQQTTSPNITMYAGAAQPTETGMTLGTDAVICCVFNGAGSSIKRNAQAEVTGNTGAANGAGFTFGRDGGGTTPSNIQAYDALVYSVAHDAAQRAAAIAALMAKRGIA